MALSIYQYSKQKQKQEPAESMCFIRSCLWGVVMVVVRRTSCGKPERAPSRSAVRTRRTAATRGPPARLPTKPPTASFPRPRRPRLVTASPAHGLAVGGADYNSAYRGSTKLPEPVMRVAQDIHGHQHEQHGNTEQTRLAGEGTRSHPQH